MTTTLATRKQSAAIRARMEQIRSDLPYRVDDARQQVRQLTDWRYQFRQHPGAVMTAAAIVGYLLVPQFKSQRQTVARDDSGVRTSQPEPARKGIIGGLVAAAATMALKSGTSMLTQHLSQALLHSSTPQNRHAQDSTLPVRASKSPNSELPL